MRRSISTPLITLLLLATIFPGTGYAQTTKDETIGLNPYVAKQTGSDDLSPFNLAYLAYQGYLEPQGIPSGGTLLDAIESGSVTAQDIMQAAVKANRIPQQVMTDRGYRHALEDQLQGLTED